MILILEAILETQKADEKLFGKDYINVIYFLAKKLQKWVYNGFPDLGDFAGMGLGATVSQVVHHEQFIEDPHKAAELVTMATSFPLISSGLDPTRSERSSQWSNHANFYPGSLGVSRSQESSRKYNQYL